MEFEYEVRWEEPDLVVDSAQFRTLGDAREWAEFTLAGVEGVTFWRRPVPEWEQVD